MKYSDLKKEVLEKIEKAGAENSLFYANCIMDKVFGKATYNDNFFAEKDSVKIIFDMTKNLVAGMPIQYVLGEWDFLDLTLNVGTGVLIPRPETEILSEIVSEMIDERQSFVSGKISIADLCSGSGCIALGVSSLCKKQIAVDAFEKSEQALQFLYNNTEKYNGYNIAVKKADVLTMYGDFEVEYDVIVSNPPYVNSGDINALSSVVFEPQMALDGGDDGMIFYHAIAKYWTPKIKLGGFCALEVGIGQATKVSNILIKYGMSMVSRVKDYNGIERIVIAQKMNIWS